MYTCDADLILTYWFNSQKDSYSLDPATVLKKKNHVIISCSNAYPGHIRLGHVGQLENVGHQERECLHLQRLAAWTQNSEK